MVVVITPINARVRPIMSRRCRLRRDVGRLSPQGQIAEVDRAIANIEASDLCSLRHNETASHSHQRQAEYGNQADEAAHQTRHPERRRFESRRFELRWFPRGLDTAWIGVMLQIEPWCLTPTFGINDSAGRPHTTHGELCRRNSSLMFYAPPSHLGLSNGLCSKPDQVDLASAEWRDSEFAVLAMS
jgi:hypothetical protein